MSVPAIQPKYILVIKSKDNAKNYTRAGAAFENQFGGLNLKLSPGVVLRWDDEVFFNLNVYEDKRGYAARTRRTSTCEEYQVDPPGGDELVDEDPEELFDWSELDAGQG